MRTDLAKYIAICEEGLSKVSVYLWLPCRA